MGRNIKQRVCKSIAVKQTRPSLRPKTSKSYPRSPGITAKSGKPQSNSTPEVKDQSAAIESPTGKGEHLGKKSGSLSALTLELI